ncbi:hypothetical protein P3S67_002270 [Capsicum chacoense]
MLEFYKTRKRVQVPGCFHHIHFVGCFMLLITSIERGMWDSLYDKLHTVHQCAVTKGGTENCADSICIEVDSAERDATNLSEKLLACESDDIHSKLSTYLVGDDAALSAASSYHVFLLNKFCKLESWLTEQFSVKHFESLGYGNIWLFLEKNMHLFSHSLGRFFTSDMPEKPPLEPSMLDCQFDLLLSQASQCLWENKEVDKRRISDLLMRQFPLVCLKVAGNDFMIDIEGYMKAKKGNLTLRSVVFSETLLKEVGVGKNNESMLDKADLENDVGQGDCIGMSKDAMKALVNAPMLIDLNLWLHWDMVFAPSLGSLVGWLLNEVNSEELLCLVTSCGKVLRVDHSATTDSFVNVLLQGNPFDTAVKLLSLLVLYGGEINVPISLLKCHARHTFEVFFLNYEEMKSHDIQDSLKHATSLCRQLVHCETTSTMNWKLLRRDRVGKIAPLASRFILDCLGYLPVEFCHFSADILLSGVQPFVKDAPLAILDECERIDQRLMLHRVGMSLGIVEWVEDKHKLSVCSDTNSLMSSRSSCLKVAEFDFSKNSTFTEEVSSNVPCLELKLASPKIQCGKMKIKMPVALQREEFGLQPDLSPVESAVLNKQHARLGRALHCLSQELYSQDSHFILELVQNADDNTYLEHVEPTLTFILQYKGIIVLNNERGFSADNIRALCDVGNSTKKGRNAGYIGKKGIGFKSVFRVTDAPEIHSNGFHIKFDVSDGQICFVLPTVVPPCDIDSYTRLASLDSDCNHGNTCIVLPFRSSLLETSAVENIVSMFSDLHPSLLLFLHRLHCIKFRNMLSDSTFLMRKEVVGNGIIKVSLGEEKLSWFVASKELQVHTIRSDISKTEISMAFTLQEALDGTYNVHLTQQPVFAFLPLRKYGLKFILQGDFVLPSSREEVDGDSPWNQWLLSEFPGLFVSAERSFCDLLCFKDNPAKGVTAYMSFVPLVGEVHGFFSGLPRMILSKLRMSNCLIIESTETEWVLPCKTLRNWTQEARNLLPDSFLHKHLGVGFLHKDIVLPDLLARALGIEEYGLKVLFQAITSLCSSVEGLKSMSLGWLCAWINSVYMMLSHGKSSAGFETEMDLMKNLKKIPFIPLSDGKYGSLDEGAIWLHVDQMGAATNDEYAPGTFPRLYSMLRTVEKNISDVCSVPINATSDGGLNSRGSVARDWVSDEFVDLLSQLSSMGDKEKCKYLLEVLDSLWDDYFADKVTGFYFSSNGERQLFDSSFTRTLRDVQWLASSLDSKLHCPRELFHGCDTVRLIFGDNAPYAIPEVRSNKLLTALGLKIQVTIDDTFAILKAWRAELTLSASLSQMSKFYNFIWSRMNTSERKVVEELCNEPFVFAPCKLVASHEDVVPGVLLSFKEVFWRDLTGSTDQVKTIFPESDPHSVQHPFTKMLCSVYPSLHDFFVKECGVNEFPHFHGYLQLLLQLSATALPSQAAKNVFQIFLKWVDELNSGSLGSEDIGFLKQGLLTTDYLVLPTAEDKWGKILYATRESDSHSIFKELSRLFSIGTPDLHLANFLHMITTMAESGSTEEQTEFFIMNSQKMPKLPADESVWSLANVPLSEDGEVGLMSSSRTMNETTPVNFRKRPKISSNWSPSDWKTAPGSVAKSPATSGLKAYAQVPTEIA